MFEVLKRVPFLLLFIFLTLCFEIYFITKNSEEKTSISIEDLY